MSAEGTVRQMARDHPGETSFAVAAALAGPGLDATRLVLEDPGPGGTHLLEAVASGGGGDLTARIALHGASALHPVSAAVIAALAAETRVIWAG